MEYNYASRGIANAGLATGIIGTTLGVLNGGAGLLNGMGGNYVTKDEADMMHQLSTKDAEIALLKADQASEIKMTEVYRQNHSELKALEAKVDAMREQQYGINAQQGVVNAQVAANIAVAQNNIADIQGRLGDLTKCVIPITNVCPEPMPAKNSWTAPT